MGALEWIYTEHVSSGWTSWESLESLESDIQWINILKSSIGMSISWITFHHWNTINNQTLSLVKHIQILQLASQVASLKQRNWGKKHGGASVPPAGSIRSKVERVLWHGWTWLDICCWFLQLQLKWWTLFGGRPNQTTSAKGFQKALTRMDMSRLEPRN